jgi:hypothetical protein
MMINNSLQQGINWIIRKTISMTEVTVKMKHFLGINTQTGASVPQITITQSTNMNVNMSGTTENRFLDWSENPQEDHIFGKTVVQSRIIGGQTSSDGISRPFMDVQTSVNDPDIAKFLRGEVDENLQPCSGFLVEPPLKEYHHLKEGHAGVWLNIVIRSQDSKWMAEQVISPLPPPAYARREELSITRLLFVLFPILPFFSKFPNIY